MVVPIEPFLAHRTWARSNCPREWIVSDVALPTGCRIRLVSTSYGCSCLVFKRLTALVRPSHSFLSQSLNTDHALTSLFLLLVFAMMAIVTVLFTLLVPLVIANDAFNPSIGVDNYVVDLGYQLNQGQAVVVSFSYFELHTTSDMHASNAHQAHQPTFMIISDNPL